MGGTSNGANGDAYILKATSNGEYFGAFGTGDGNNDSILHLNAPNVLNDYGDEWLISIVINNEGVLFSSGHTTGAIEEISFPTENIFRIQVDSTTGELVGN